MWNWQQKDWPHFQYNSKDLSRYESEFLHLAGVGAGSLRHVAEDDHKNLVTSLLAEEAFKTSEIEGEYLDRVSLQSSLRRQFGLEELNRRVAPAEQGIAEMMRDLYQNFSDPLTDKALFKWHRMLISGRRDLKAVGKYRTHEDPMQVISGAIHDPKVHFEAPPSKEVAREMKRFTTWFRKTSPRGKEPLSALTRAGIAHLYFVSIHPFEDGNGRIGRALSEKAISESLGEPTLIGLSKVIVQHKKKYYEMLERSNKNNEITEWLIYFSQVILEAQNNTQVFINFLIQKTKFYDKHKDELNERQAKVVARIFREGPEGFTGGLSAKNYISITSTSRATATRDLQDLMQKGILKSKGELKGTRYYLQR